jgi:hypothetical protein
VSRLLALASMVLVLGCSDLTEGTGGVVVLEIRVPSATSVEVGEVLQLSAEALDAEGNPANVPITWRSSDPALTIDDTGLVTGVTAGTAQVQAFAGSLSSARIQLGVIPRADTLALVGDSVIVVPPEAAASAPLVVQVLSFAQVEPLPNRPVIYTVSFPATVIGAPATLPGGVLVDTITTTTAPNTSMTLSRVTGVTAPDSAFVTVRSYRASNADVAGSGQRFIVLFQ